MKKTFNSFMISSMISSVLFIILGIFLFRKPDFASDAIGYTVGALILITAIVSIIKYFVSKTKSNFFSYELIYGIITGLFGVLVIVNPVIITNGLTILVGIWMIISGAMKLKYALELKKHKEEYWLVTLAISVLTVSLGLLIVFNPFQTTMLVTEIIGAFIILYGVLDLAQSFILKRNFKTLEKILIEKK